MFSQIKNRWRLSTAITSAALVVLLALMLTRQSPLFYVLLGWDVLIWVYMLLVWLFMWRAEAGNIPAYAEKHDEGAMLILLFFSLGAALSFVSMVIFLLHADLQQQSHPSLFIGLTSMSLIGAWLVVPSAFTMHYAHEFYLNRQKNHHQAPALLFPDKIAQPDYMDFAYFSFTISVANQTADIAPGNAKMRRLALLQSLIAFIFNTSILGLAINMVAGMLN